MNIKLIKNNIHFNNDGKMNINNSPSNIGQINTKLFNAYGISNISIIQILIVFKNDNIMGKKYIII